PSSITAMVISASTATSSASTRKWASASRPATPSPRSEIRGAGPAPSCISKSARPASPSTLGRGSKPPPLKGQIANCINALATVFGQIPGLMSFEASMEPYAQLVRSLLPRATALCLFDNSGKLLWSSVASTNPELFALVLQSIAQVDANGDGIGQHCALPDE